MACYERGLFWKRTALFFTEKARSLFRQGTDILLEVVPMKVSRTGLDVDLVKVHVKQNIKY